MRTSLRLRISVDPLETVIKEYQLLLLLSTYTTTIAVVAVPVPFGNTSTRVLIPSQGDNTGSSRQGDEIVFVQMSKGGILGVVITLVPERLAHRLVTFLELSRVAATVSTGGVQGNHSLVTG